MWSFWFIHDYFNFYKVLLSGIFPKKIEVSVGDNTYVAAHHPTKRQNIIHNHKKCPTPPTVDVTCLS